jgi:Domain of unknown function (DUF4304)
VKTENPVKIGIESAMKGLPFRRKSTTWYHESEEAVVVLNVQKSNFGEQYYINLGALVKGLGSTREGIPPRENECHLRLRIESLVPEKQELIQRIMLNLEDDTVSSAEREQSVCRLVAEVAIPFLLQCTTREGIRAAFQQGRLTSAFIHKRLREAVLV